MNTRPWAEFANLVSDDRGLGINSPLSRSLNFLRHPYNEVSEILRSAQNRLTGNPLWSWRFAISRQYASF